MFASTPHSPALNIGHAAQKEGKVGGLELATNRLHEELAALDKAAEELGGRLTPIRQPTPMAGPPSASKDAACSPATEAVLRAVDRVAALRSYLLGVTSTLDL